MLVCALSVALTVGAPAALATGSADDIDDGLLDLNTNVLVNESVGAGTSGDFAVRGRLFLEDLSARAREQQEARARSLGVVDTLTFEQPHVVAEEYQAVRNALFAGYSTDVLSEARDARVDSPVLYVLVLVVGVPLVFIGGVSSGRFWARRRRASA